MGNPWGRIRCASSSKCRSTRENHKPNREPCHRCNCAARTGVAAVGASRRRLVRPRRARSHCTSPSRPRSGGDAPPRSSPSSRRWQDPDSGGWRERSLMRTVPATDNYHYWWGFIVCTGLSRILYSHTAPPIQTRISYRGIHIRRWSLMDAFVIHIRESWIRLRYKSTDPPQPPRLGSLRCDVWWRWPTWSGDSPVAGLQTLGEYLFS